MVNKILVGLIIALLAAIIIVGWVNHQAGVKQRILKAEYEAMRVETEENSLIQKAQIEGLRQIIEQKDRHISQLNEHIVEKQVEISTLHEQTDKLEAEYETLLREPDKIDNLTQQVTLWKQKFSIAETIIESKDKIIFDMNQKYVAQLDISNYYKKLYENEYALRLKAEARIKLYENQITGLKIGGTIKTGLVIGLAGVVIYGLVR
jgi:uncharacterized protein HemX